MDDAAGPGGGDPNPLLSLLRECVVRVDRAGEFAGTGLLVAPGEVLTCAHVVHGGDDIAVTGTGWGSAASVAVRAPDLEADSERADFYPLPDLALLRLADPPPGHPCARLDRDLPAAGSDPDLLWLTGFGRGIHEGGKVERAGASLEFEGVFEEDGWKLLKLRDGQVVGGFSGCPVLNTRTGSVCGLVDSSRGEATSLGGFAISIEAVEAAVPGLLERNAAHQDGDARWATSVADEAAAVAARRGEAEKLPLLTPMSPLRPDGDYAPSDLLKPRHGVVSLVDRGDLQAHLMRWREADERLGIVLLTGAGGYGKTRLAAEECARALQAGWTAGLLAIDSSTDVDAAVERLAGWKGRLLVAVDYAETRPALVSALVMRLARRPGDSPARLILVCRQVQTRDDLKALFAVGDWREEIAAVLDAAEPVRLNEHGLDRRRLFETGYAAFAARVGSEAKSPPRPSLSEAHFARPLFVLAAALLVARDPSVDIDELGRDGLMLELINRHETQYWERWNQSLEVDLDPITQRRAVAILTVLGAETEEEALAAVAIVPGLEDASAERKRAVARWLSHLYSDGCLDAEPAIAPVEPDMLAEALVGREYTATPELLGASLDVATDRQLTRALAVLTRTAEGNERLKETLRSCLDERLEALVMQAARSGRGLTAALDAAVTLARPKVGAAALKAAPAALGHLSITLKRLAVERNRELVEEDREANLPELALALNTLAVSLSNEGRYEEAVEASKEAILHCRELASDDPERQLPELAGSLNDLATFYGVLRRNEEALAAIEEAVGYWRDLVAEDPERFRANLAMALNNHSLILSNLGRDKEALAAIEKAVEDYRELARKDPGTYLTDLASALNNLSTRLEDVGRWQESRAASEESVRHRRQLAESGSSLAVADLASGLNNLSHRLGGESAVAAASEAIDIYGPLVQLSPERYLPDLARAINSLAVALDKATRYEEAAKANELAVEHWRRLAEVDSARHLADLAMALNNQAITLARTGKAEEARIASEESVLHHRTLVEDNPLKYRIRLSAALATLGNVLGECGLRKEAVEALEEAVDHRRQLMAQDSRRYMPPLAETVSVLSQALGRIRRYEESVAASEEALGYWQQLVEEDRDRHLPDLAAGLSIYSINLISVGREEEALGASREAIGYWRELVGIDRGRFLPELAGAVGNLSIHLGRLGQSEEGLATCQEAIGYWRELAKEKPAQFLSDLAGALNSLSLRLGEVGRRDEAVPEIDSALDEHEEPRGRGLILLTRSRHFARVDDADTALEDGWMALESLQAEGRLTEVGQARSNLRAIRAAQEEAFDAAWEARGDGEQPVWLRVPISEPETVERLIEWVEAASWEESRQRIEEHSDAILSEQGEAALEHLIDSNPGNGELRYHLVILRTARAEGLSKAYQLVFAEDANSRRQRTVAAWLSKEGDEAIRFLAEHSDALLDPKTERELVEAALSSADRSPLLIRAGLLGLVRIEGPEKAWRTAGAERPSLDDSGWLGGDDEPRLLQLARIDAGLNGRDPEPQFRLAVAAVGGGKSEEARGALARCRDLLPSWDVEHYVSRLAALSDAHAKHRDELGALIRELDGAAGADDPPDGA